MTVQMMIELPSVRGAEPILQAIHIYKTQLRLTVKWQRSRVAEYEQRYGVDTARFLREMTAEDLAGGESEYAEWVAEARQLEELEDELTELEHARVHLPWISPCD